MSTEKGYLKDAMWKNRLYEQMKRKEITIYKLSKITGITYEVLRRTFNGNREMRVGELIKILDSTGIEFENLIREVKK